jgi:hypothetical protein
MIVNLVIRLRIFEIFLGRTKDPLKESHPGTPSIESNPSTPPPQNIHKAPSKTFNQAVKELEILLSQIVKTWQENQKRLFPSIKLPEDWQNRLHTFYNLVWQKLPSGMKSRVINAKKFNFWSLEEKSNCFNRVKLSFNGNYDEEIKNILRQLNETNEKELLEYKNICKCLFGGDNHKDLADPLLQLINSSMNKYLVKPLTDGKHVFNLSCLGSGTVGIAFKVNIYGHEFVIKLPKVPPDRQLFKHFQYEQEQLEIYHDLVKKGYKPKKLLIPELISKDQGITVTKFYKGEKLSSDPSSKVNKKYIEKGLSDDFLLDFIKLYKEFANRGADLSDISVENYFYNADTQSLEFFEFAGFDPEHSNKFRELKELKEYSIYSSLVFTLLTAICTLEHQTFGIRCATAIKIKDVNKDVFDNRIEQLKKVLNQALQQKILDRQELKQGIEYLYDVCSSPEVSPNLKISKKGLEYLGWLKAWVEK